jgi:hypothetical protein
MTKWDKKNNWIFININGDSFQLKVSLDDLLKCLEDSVIDEDFIALVAHAVYQRSDKIQKKIISALLQEN